MAVKPTNAAADLNKKPDETEICSVLTKHEPAWGSRPKSLELLLEITGTKVQIRKFILGTCRV